MKCDELSLELDEKEGNLDLSPSYFLSFIFRSSLKDRHMAQSCTLEAYINSRAELFEQPKQNENRTQFYILVVDLLSTVSGMKKVRIPTFVVAWPLCSLVMQ